MRKKIRKRYIIIVLLLAAGCLFLDPSVIYSQKLTHTVQKGDTLWDICEHYYGDPNLWPKLWQMNPFITNPHLLEPGDIITLFEQEPIKEVEVVEVKVEEPPVKEEEPKQRVMGIDVGYLTNVNAIGFLSLEEIIPWGTIFASEKDNIMLSEGDTAYVLFDEDRTIEVGDEFSIGRSSDLLENPVTGKDLGYTFKVNGILKVEERLGLAHAYNKYYNKKNVFKTKVIAAYESVIIDDSVIPYTFFSSCILPVSINKDILGNIVASKGQAKLIGQNSIVYIDLGLKDGINRGNIFDVVEPKNLEDPNPAREEYPGDIILPDRQLGKIMILESRPDTSTAIVLSSTEEFSTGIYITDLSWAETPDFLLSIANCPVE